tara:strand:+ start:230 stop:763 length:534 start_codon:yes stop_codon:yes gene_type:complete
MAEYLNNKSFEQVIDKFQSFKRHKARYELIIDDLEESKKRKISKNRYYNPEPLDKYVDGYNVIVIEFDDSQKQLANAFYKLSENIVRCFKFSNVDPDDAIQEGVLICFEKIDRFDPEKGRAFNYMTTCILNHFRQLWRSARNYNELKKKYHLFLQITSGQINTGRVKKTSKYNLKDD